MTSLSILLAIVTAVLLLPTVSDLLALARLALRGSAAKSATTTALPNLLFLVPAHNEELLIESCLRSLAGVQYPEDRMSVAVVADNCTDRTACLARAAGVRCLERVDRVHRGKPAAIAWALDHLPVNDYDAVVIVDADSVVEPRFAMALAATGSLTEKAVQCYNDVANRSDNSLTRMAAVFSAMRFRFVNPLKQRAQLNVPLANGLCIGTAVLRTHGWSAFSVCEDWELYASLTEAGVPIEGAPSARLYSQEARSLRQSSTQRRRWTAGRLAVLARYARALMRSRRVRAHQKLDALAELSAPGPAVHLGTVVVLSAIALLLRVPGAPWIVIGLCLTLARPAFYTLAALRVDPEPFRAVMAFAFLPIYTIWRLGVQLASIPKAGHTPWVRTQRHR